MTVAVLGVSCTSCGATRPSDTAVYSCFLDGWLASDANKGIDHPYVVVVESTISGPDPYRRLSEAEIKDTWLRLQKRMPRLRLDTVQNFIALNEVAAAIDTRSIKTTAPVVGLSGDEAARIFTLEQCWEAFYKKFPKARGVMRLSRPGVSSDDTQTLVYCDFGSGYLAGAGSYYLLEMNGERWQIAGEYVARQA
ncbi:MAG TPA: hypothetical protein VFY93_16745 [Planctomycetota bacterium]|nr:hypothetical protein [Planctomycetota bacterium]